MNYIVLSHLELPLVKNTSLNYKMTWVWYLKEVVTMTHNRSKKLFLLFGVLAWLSVIILFILPILAPYQNFIESDTGLALGWIIVLLVFITLFYVAIVILDIYSPIATQVLQFVLLTVVIICAVPSITAFILASFVVDISIVEIFIPIVLVILASMLHILWFTIPFIQNKQTRKRLKSKAGL